MPTALAPASMYSTTSSALVTPPMPMIGILTGLGHLIDHPQHDRLQRRGNQSAKLVAERRAEIVGADLQRQEGVGDDQAIGAGGFGGTCAIETMSPALGESFTHSGFFVFARIAVMQSRV